MASFHCAFKIKKQNSAKKVVSLFFTPLSHCISAQKNSTWYAIFLQKAKPFGQKIRKKEKAALSQKRLCERATWH